MRKSNWAETTKQLAERGILISVGNRGDAGVYILDLMSREKIAAAFPLTTQLPYLMLGQKRLSDFDRLQPQRWEAVIPLLTGLTREQVAQMGGAAIYDTESDRVVLEWPPEAFNR